MRDGSLPPDDAYERVTNPERFRPVHLAADALVARLESEYRVERRAGDLPPHEGVIRQVELVPEVGATLLIRWDDFPGVSVRYGSLHEEGYPQCGCDACEDREQPANLIEDLERKIRAVVAGRFTETLVPAHLSTGLKFEFRFEDGLASGGDRIPEGHPRRNGPAEIVWPAWPRRNPPDDGRAGGFREADD